MERKPEGRLPAPFRKFQIIPMVLFIPRPLNTIKQFVLTVRILDLIPIN